MQLYEDAACTTPLSPDRPVSEFYLKVNVPFSRLGSKQLYRVDTPESFISINIGCDIDDDGIFSHANVELSSLSGNRGVFDSDRVGDVVTAGAIYHLREESGRAVSFTQSEYGQVSEFALPPVTGVLGFATSSRAIGDPSMYAAIMLLDEDGNKILVSQSGMDFDEFARASIDEDKEEYSFPFSPSPVTDGNVAQFALGEVVASHDLYSLSKVTISRWYFAGDGSDDLLFEGVVSDSGQTVDAIFGDEQITRGDTSPCIVPW